MPFTLLNRHRMCGLFCSSMLLPAALSAQMLATPIAQALAKAQLPADAVALMVVAADAPPGAAPRLAHRIDNAMNPASVMKLVTTFAALDLLGPAFSWHTPVYLEGALHGNALNGSVYVRGSGDPKLVMESTWLLLKRLRALGVHQIQGDLVLDRSAFAAAERQAGDFDGEPFKPYNASPDALLVNYKSVLLTVHPEAGTQRARVQMEPALYGVSVSPSVALTTGPCGDYRAQLKADFSNPDRIRLNGSFAAACGEKMWPVAYADPDRYAPRMLQALWHDMGGSLRGTVRYGAVPASVLQQGPVFEHVSPPLADVVRDINKFSNNVMTQQLFLTLGRPAACADDASSAACLATPASFDTARARIATWWTQRMGNATPPVLENGAGLSRLERISAHALAQLLQTAYRSPLMSELMSSLPVNGVDGTLRRGPGNSNAHLKTGTLDGVIARAGFVDGDDGRRYVLVALINDANANTPAARQFMDTLIDWTAHTAPAGN